MPREFFELKELESLVKLVHEASVVIRSDPFIFISLYGLTLYGLIFYFDLRRSKEGEVKELFNLVKDKMVLVNKVTVSDSIKEFIEETLSERDGDCEVNIYGLDSPP